MPTPKKLDTVPVLDEAPAVEYARTALTDGDKAEGATSELIMYAPGGTPPRRVFQPGFPWSGSHQQPLALRPKVGCRFG